MCYYFFMSDNGLPQDAELDTDEIELIFDCSRFTAYKITKDYSFLGLRNSRKRRLVKASDLRQKIDEREKELLHELSQRVELPRKRLEAVLSLQMKNRPPDPTLSEDDTPHAAPLSGSLV